MIWRLASMRPHNPSPRVFPLETANQLLGSVMKRLSINIKSMILIKILGKQLVPCPVLGCRWIWFERERERNTERESENIAVSNHFKHTSLSLIDILFEYANQDRSRLVQISSVPGKFITTLWYRRMIARNLVARSILGLNIGQ